MAHPVFRCPACSGPIDVSKDNIISPHAVPPQSVALSARSSSVMAFKRTMISRCLASGQELIIGHTCGEGDDGIEA